MKKIYLQGAEELGTATPPLIVSIHVGMLETWSGAAKGRRKFGSSA